MIRSISNNAKFAGIDLSSGFPELMRMPNLADMIRDIGERRQIYTVVGKISSHAIHGSLANLLHYYLDPDPHEQDAFIPAKRFPAGHINQLVFNSIFVLDACTVFVEHNFGEDLETVHLSEVLRTHTAEIKEINLEIAGSDFVAEE